MGEGEYEHVTVLGHGGAQHGGQHAQHGGGVAQPDLDTLRRLSAITVEVRAPPAGWSQGGRWPGQWGWLAGRLVQGGRWPGGGAATAPGLATSLATNPVPLSPSLPLPLLPPAPLHLLP
jgi:hypothetical protein